LAGTVDANVETFLSDERNGAAVVAVVLADVVAALDVAGAEAAVELLLLELPQPVRATAADAASATNKGLGTGRCSSLMVRSSCSIRRLAVRTDPAGCSQRPVVARREHLS
jgi:hypothetical protein